MEKPKFNVVKETQYGPVLRKKGYEEGGEKKEWLDPKQRKQLSVLLASLGLSVVALKDTNQTTPADVQDAFQKTPNSISQEGEVRRVQTDVIENPQNAALHATLESETEESLMERINVSSCLDQGGSIEECLDGVSSQVHEFVQNLKKEDIMQTAVLAEEARMNKDFFVLKSNVRDNIEPIPVPETVQDILKSHLEGWIAQESRFKKNAVSSSGAKGYAQFKPRIYKSHMGTSEVSGDINDHLDGMGSLAAENYHYLVTFAGKSALETLEGQYDSEEDYATKFVAPALIKAHNTGGPALGRAIKLFVDTVPVSEMKRGKDLLPQFIDFAFHNAKNYSNEAAEYLARVLAFDSALKDVLSETDVSESSEPVASRDESEEKERG